MSCTSDTSTTDNSTTSTPSGCSRLRRFGRWTPVAAAVAAAAVIGTTVVGADNASVVATAHAAEPAADSAAPAGSTSPDVLTVAVDAGQYAEQLRDGVEREVARAAQEAERIAQEAARIAQEIEAARPKLAFPAAGTFTSGFGPRWGTNHNGIDIANAIGTPILAVTDGVVIETGPASGFGLWVRIAQDDGTIGVFGHIDASLVSVGQHVTAGQQIATMGNRGQSTGPHLHYEVWLPGGVKVDPVPWFQQRGIPVPGDHLS